ncbi:MAG: 4-alpha-glucanotransferase [Phycisphaerae bacterium]
MAPSKPARKRQPKSRRARQPQLNQRAAGILLHPTSLPGPHGSGDFGSAAYRFADFLVTAGHRWWQMLPIGPIGPGNSPYSSVSAFAGGRHLINLDLLVKDGLLAPGDVEPLRTPREDKVHYASVLPYREQRLRRAFANFQRRGRQRTGFERFCAENRGWLDDYTLFCALKRAYKDVAWTRWDRAVAFRRVAAIRSARRELREEIEYEQLLQYLFDHQWFALKRYCNQRGVSLIGDLPIFVSHDSCDVWANQSLYKLDKQGQPTVVSGVPPDYFSRTGQLWGHPLYRWERHAKTGYAWWVERFGNMLNRFDAIRIDHFLGFNRLWNIPAGAKTALRGTWTKSPGDEVFHAVKRALGSLPIIAEDLGLLIPEAAALRDRWGFPGMRVLQFAFDGTRKALYDQPHRYLRNCVAYTGTHDNNTTVGWFQSLPKRGRKGPDRLTVRQRALHYAGSDGRKIHEDFIRLLYVSVANTAIIPMQDALGLDARARMNFPSTLRGNWEWRARAAALSRDLAGCLRSLAEAYERASGFIPGNQRL